MKRRIIRADLKEAPSNAFLYCWKCGNRFSATYGDYFWKRADEPFRCADGHRPINMRLVTSRVVLTEVSVQS